MNLKYSKMMMRELHEYRPAYYRAVLLLTLGISLGISIVHFLVPGYFFVIHGFLRRLYYIPLILSGLLYGLRKTIFLLGLIFLSYGPFILLSSREDLYDKAYELLMFCVIGVITAILSDEARERRIELQHAYHETVLRLAIAAEYKDENTGKHLLRISRYSELIAKNLKLSPNLVTLIKLASVMHDIGKIGIPDDILSSKGKLDDHDWKIMQSHTAMGYNILKESNSELLETAARIALAHHERFDGSGYPKGLKGDQIPLEARIISVADAFDALTTQRPYKPAFSMGQAVELMKGKSGELFDPEVLAAFLKDPGKVREIMETLEKEPIQL